MKLNKDFENFLAEQGLLIMFRLLPTNIKRDIENKYKELKENENGKA